MQYAEYLFLTLTLIYMNNLRKNFTPFLHSLCSPLHFFHSWFFGDIKRQEAERFLLQPGNSHGSFLIRRSDNRAGTAQNLYALSIRDGDIVRHYRIKATDSGRFFIARKSEFSTLSEMVDYYTQASDGLMVNLREPCVKVSEGLSIVLVVVVNIVFYNSFS